MSQHNVGAEGELGVSHVYIQGGDDTVEWDVEGPFEWRHSRLGGEEMLGAGSLHLFALLLEEAGSDWCFRQPG